MWVTQNHIHVLDESLISYGMPTQLTKLNFNKNNYVKHLHSWTQTNNWPIKLLMIKLKNVHNIFWHLKKSFATKPRVGHQLAPKEKF